MFEQYMCEHNNNGKGKGYLIIIFLIVAWLVSMSFTSCSTYKSTAAKESIASATSDSLFYKSADTISESYHKATTTNENTETTEEVTEYDTSVTEADGSHPVKTIKRTITKKILNTESGEDKASINSSTEIIVEKIDSIGNYNIEKTNEKKTFRFPWIVIPIALLMGVTGVILRKKIDF